MDTLPEDLIVLICEYLPDDLDKQHIISLNKKLYTYEKYIKFNYIHRHDCIIKNYDPKSIKSNIRRLTFARKFDEVIPTIPDFITGIKFKNCFDQSADIILSSVTRLFFSEYYNYIGTIPATVKHLSIGINIYTIRTKTNFFVPDKTRNELIKSYKKYVLRTVTYLSFN